jgi:hypothetical protein
LVGEPTPAFEDRWQHDLSSGLLSKDTEGQAFPVGFSITILSLAGNCGSDYDRWPSPKHAQSRFSSCP